LSRCDFLIVYKLLLIFIYFDAVALGGPADFWLRSPHFLTPIIVKLC